MQPLTTQARIRRLFRKRKRQAEHISALAEDQLERNLVRRFGRLMLVRRFVLVWGGLCLLLLGCVVMQTRALGSYYQTMVPVAGGIYREGIIGTYTNANPLYASGQVNDAVSKLLFAGLFKYDDKNRLAGDLAQRYDVDKAGTTYTVKLKPNLTWHDGKPLTAADVLFTYQTIQNPDAQSPLGISWQNVTVSAPDQRTVVFKLPNPLASFPYSLTTGIVPKHSLDSVPATNLRSVAFNTTHPVGSGPFQLKTIEVKGNSPSTRQEQIELVPFKQYYGGAPAISSFIVHTYPDNDQMTADFHDRNLNAMVGLQDIPAAVADIDNIQATVMPLTAANMVFFKTTDGVLADKAVRQALVAGADTERILDRLRKPVLPVREPFLPGTTGYDATLQQKFAGVQVANDMLEKQGWARGADGIRVKDKKKLAFKLYAQDTDEYRQVTGDLKRQWRQLGVDMQLYLQREADMRSTVSSHSYDALLYGISLGVDPDGFVYWHSSQNDARSARLNLSEYTAPAADAALEAGRTRLDPALRTIKYKPFLQAWLDDAPALGLYRPRFVYVTRGQVFGLHERPITVDTDRFNNVERWKVRSAAMSAD